MREWINSHKATSIVLGIWIVLFLLQRKCFPILMGKGINELHSQYYRFITASFVHTNIIHLVANVLGLYWVGVFLEEEIGSVKFLVFGLIVATVSQIIFSFIYEDAKTSFGGSPFVFALIGLIAVYEIMKPEFPRIKMGTYCGNWIVLYPILGNVPILPFMNFSTVVIHLLSFGIGAAAAIVGILIL